MALTSKLGITDSYPGNIVPGIGGSSAISPYTIYIPTIFGQIFAPLSIGPKPRILAIHNWGPYGTWSGTAPTIFPYNIISPSMWAVASESSPPWLGVGSSDLVLSAVPVSPNSAANPGAGVYLNIGAQLQEFVHGFWWKCTTFPSSTVAIWRANDSQNTSQTYGVDHSYLSLASTGIITLLNSSNTSFGATSALSLNTWYFLDIYVYIGDLNGGTGKVGAMILNVYNTSGTLVTSVSNANCQTRGSGFLQSYHADAFTFDAEFDNIYRAKYGPGYILDTRRSGSGAMKGLRYFQPYFMQSASTPAQFTSSDSGTPLTELSVTPATTTPYQSNATQGQQSFFLPPAYAGGGQIDCLGLRGVAEKDAEGARCFASIVSSAGVTAANPRGLTNGTFKDFIDLYEFDPNTAIGWLVAGLDAAKQGIEVFN